MVAPEGAVVRGVPVASEHDHIELEGLTTPCRGVRAPHPTARAHAHKLSDVMRKRERESWECVVGRQVGRQAGR
eukprot:1231537-Rhodomonas_salina.2